MWGIKRFLFCCLCAIAIIAIGNFTHNAYANTETINWYVDGETYDTTTCQSGDDIELPTTPTKLGYTFVGWEKVYIPIEYLQFNTVVAPGINYSLDTGIIPNAYTTFRIKFTMGVVDSNDRTIIGAGAYSNNSTYRLFAATSGNLYVDISNSSNGRATANKILNTNSIYDLSIGMVYIKNYTTNSIIAGSIRGISYSNPQQSTFKVLPRDFQGKLYLLQIWDNGSLVRDFIPVLDSDNGPCMYDNIEHELYCAPSPDYWIAGPVITE